ncbi:MAG TPA: FAD-dependent oxidoreductase [Gemmatimonadaceae bacterium]|nr:FAD-dependent oxidoreductase [Gemmatimonadaceae bacterium]
MSLPHVVVLGAGPAGVGAAYELRRTGKATVTVLEQQSAVGGNSGSFEAAGQRLDFGSHRLHPACEPRILRDIQQLLGDDLLLRPRRGRIRLRGKWIHFPLKPVDLFLRLDRGFAASVLRDMVARKLKHTNGSAPTAESFATVLRASLGPTICDDFYFPYARKIWGRAPQDLSAIQARRRVSASSFGKLARKVISQIPGLKPPGAGQFYYPRRGFGQISEAYAEAARAHGAELLLGWKVTGVERSATNAERWVVEATNGTETKGIEADFVWSTLPISLLARLMRPAAPREVLDAAGQIDYRSMMLIYLHLDIDRFTDFYDAHYFPGADVRITRLSEPKTYAALAEPRGRTTLCAELPCSPDDPWWSMSDAELGKLVSDDLARAGLPLPRPPVSVTVKRLRHAYPIYLTGYEHPFGVLDAWSESIPRLLTYGRQGLFAHDNTHHALAMAYGAVECLEGGQFDEARWREHRNVFATHVVED